jgi:hypothetical protein
MEAGPDARICNLVHGEFVNPRPNGSAPAIRPGRRPTETGRANANRSVIMNSPLEAIQDDVGLRMESTTPFARATTSSLEAFSSTARLSGNGDITPGA